MSDRMKVWNDWFKLSVQATQLAWEAQNIVALRLMRMAAGSRRPFRSATNDRRKIVAAVEAQAAGAAGTCAGDDAHRVTKRSWRL
jgi:hypothetical protein